MTIYAVTILGAGAWGSALATLARKQGHRVCIWSRRSSQTLTEATQDADVVVSAVSMKGVREIAVKLQSLPPHAILVTATKGLDLVTTRTPSQIWQATLTDRSIVVLSGPNLSKEIEAELPAATIAASHDVDAAKTIQGIFSSDAFRVYTNTDPLGTELGGTLKNVMAIATGVCDGLQLGTNAKAALLSRGAIEMVRVGTSLGGKVETFWGLSGLGDLLATCNSPLSRNYQVGYGLAQGKSLMQVMDEIQGTAEGVNTSRVLVKLAAQRGIEVPIAYRVDRLLNGQISPEKAVAELMERTLTSEAVFPQFH